MKLRLYGERPGWGEDFPIYDSLLTRAGWSLVQQGEFAPADEHAKIVWTFDPPAIYEKTTRTGLRLRMMLKGIRQKDDAWYWLDYEIVSSEGDVLLTLSRTDWADWDSNGDPFYARDGKLFRLPRERLDAVQTNIEESAKLIADLTSLKFEAIESPSEARTW